MFDVRPECSEVLGEAGFPRRGCGDGRTELLAAFDELSAARLTSPFLKDLAAWGKDAREKQPEASSDTVPLDCRVLRERLEGMNAERLENAYLHLMERIANETKYLSELEDSGLAQAIKTNFREEHYGALVAFVDEHSLIGKQMAKRHEEGVYFPQLDTCVIRGKRPSPAEMWSSLAASGTLPPVISVLDHELTHDAQYTKGQHVLLGLPPVVRLGGSIAVGYLFGAPALLGFQLSSLPIAWKCMQHLANMPLAGELHACAAAARSPSFGNTNLDETEEIISHVLDTGRYGNAYVEGAMNAFSGILILNLLGSNDKEIGRIVSRCGMDASTKTFPKLKAALERRREELGLEDERLFECAVRCALARNVIVKHDSRSAAQRIAREELEKLMEGRALSRPRE